MILAHDRLKSPNGTVRQWFVFLHGILGTRANWRGIARKFLVERPDWGALTVDLPAHGDSVEYGGAVTIEGCAGAVAELCGTLDEPVRAVLGHSFGGKVATALAGRLVDAGAAPDDLWIADSPPEVRERDSASVTDRVFAVLDQLPPSFASRDAFVAHLAGHGIAESTGRWLAMNLVRSVDGFRFGPQIPPLHRLMDDFARWDGWPELGRVSQHSRCHLIVGGRSGAYPPAARARAEAGAKRGIVDVCVLPDAGHWVHADDPAGLLQILLRSGARGE